MVDHAQLFAAIRDIKQAGPGRLTQVEVNRINAILADDQPTTIVEAPGRLTRRALQSLLKVTVDDDFGDTSKKAFIASITNRNAPALTDDDFARVAGRLKVGVPIIRAVRKVEAPRGPFDEKGRLTALYERHVFARNTEPPGRFNRQSPDLSGGPYGPGGYGSYASQYDKLTWACELDPEAALRACSWGAFQVLGENATALGYASVQDMVWSLVTSEAAHLECFARFVTVNGLDDELRQCRPGDPASCIPFVSRYNGEGYARFDYHKKLAAAAL